MNETKEKMQDVKKIDFQDQQFSTKGLTLEFLGNSLDEQMELRALMLEALKLLHDQTAQSLKLSSVTHHPCQ